MTDSAVETRTEMRHTVAEFLRREAGPAAIRGAMEGERGFDLTLFERGATELGLGAALVPERLGGLGLTFADAAVVIEELGRVLVPSPLMTTLVASLVLAEVVEEGATTQEAEEVLTDLGTRPLSIGITEPPADSARSPLTATEFETGWLLHGAVDGVPHGDEVDLLLVTAGTGEHAAVFLVSTDAPGVTRRGQGALDHTRRLAEIEMHAVPATRISPEHDEGAVAARLRSLMLIALAVESAAAAAECLDRTVEYLKVRQQFGRPIGSFQALKHRCADLAVAVHGAAATASYAVYAADEKQPDTRVLALLAKSVCADTLMQVAGESLQMHGAIGFTFEHDVHLYLKRGKANQILFGSGPRLRREIATLIGL